MEQKQLQNSTLILVLGILSIPACCVWGIGLILGIITLVLANKSSKLYMGNPEMYTGFSNVKTGKVLAIIGIVLSLAYLLLAFWAISTFGWEALQNPELLQERMQETLGQ
ncbi:MAG: CCC motif membrane protein [Flavobacteriaceae bacterium]